MHLRQVRVLGGHGHQQALPDPVPAPSAEDAVPWPKWAGRSRQGMPVRTGYTPRTGRGGGRRDGRSEPGGPAQMAVQGLEFNAVQRVAGHGRGP